MKLQKLLPTHINNHLLDLSKEFQLCENPNKSTGKEEKFIITLVLHLHPNIHRLNPSTPNHKEFLENTKFMFHVIIDHQNFTQKSHDKFKEATQYMILESTLVNYLYQFLGNKSNPGNVKKLKTRYDFEQITNKFRNSNTSNKMHVHCTSPSIAPKTHDTCIHKTAYFMLNLQNKQNSYR